MIVAIDGPAGTGKGTISKLISDRLNFTYIDTGAMYRAVALKMLRENVGIADEEGITKILNEINIELKNIDGKQKVYLDGEDVSEEIRTPEVTAVVSPVSAVKIIREKMVELQRAMASGADVIMEGRDITTVVFPNAEVKIYLTADSKERAKRRHEEYLSKGVEITYEEVYEGIMKRDENDINKPYGALKVAEDAIYVDTTNMGIEEVYERVKEIINSKR